MYDTQIAIFWWGYKPTFNWGAATCSWCNMIYQVMVMFMRKICSTLPHNQLVVLRGLLSGASRAFGTLAAIVEHRSSSSIKWLKRVCSLGNGHDIDVFLAERFKICMGMTSYTQRQIRLLSPSIPILSRSSWKYWEIFFSMIRPHGMAPVVSLSDSTICWKMSPRPAPFCTSWLV